MFSIYKMLFLALKNFQIVKITPPQILPPGKKIPPAVFSTFWHEARETPKILGEKKQKKNFMAPFYYDNF